MREAILQRQPSTDEGTPGRLTTDSGWECATLELPWRDNRRGLSSIPAGRYLCRWGHSASRGRALYWVHGVPGREAIQLHSANLAGDVDRGFVAQVKGCIALGRTHGRLRNQLAVLASRATVAEFEALLGHADFWLEIRNAAAVEPVG